jgi:hypothetical protein
MVANTKTPPPRNLDIYRLVVARGLKQADAAVLFNVTPVRICQVVRRVRRWVDHTIGDWLFPRRDDLRFYAALESVQIRVHELENDPENVFLTGPGWTYSREMKSASETGASHDVNSPLPLSCPPINSLPSASETEIAATSCAASGSPTSHVHDLAHRLAELLILWQKSRSLTGAFKSW